MAVGTLAWQHYVTRRHFRDEECPSGAGMRHRWASKKRRDMLRVDRTPAGGYDPRRGRMRIATLGPLYPWRGGVAQCHGALVESLARRHAVLPITYRRQYPRLLFPGRTQLDPQPRRVRWQALRAFSPLVPRSWLRTARAIREWHADALVIQWWHPFFALGLGFVARRVRREMMKVLFVLHNVTPHEPFPAALPLTRWALSAGQGFLAHTDAVARELESVGVRGVIRRVALPAPLPVPERLPDRRSARARLRLPADGCLVLFFGHVRRYKGLDVLLDSIALLTDARVLLLVAGEFYEPRAHYEALCEERGIRDRVLFRDAYVPDDEVPTYFAAADIVVVPYRTASQSAVIPLAHAMGRPVVATETGGLAESVREGTTGFLCPPGNPQPLAARIRELAARGASAEEEAALRAEGARTSWWEVAAEIERIIEAIRP